MKCTGGMTAADFFDRTLKSIIGLHAPLELHFFKANDLPSITPYFKKIMLERDNAFITQNYAHNRKLRNKVHSFHKKSTDSVLSGPH